MKLSDALQIINKGKSGTHGFRVHFEKHVKCFYKADYFPDRDEPPLKTEAEAWELAQKFSVAADSSYSNIYVVDGKTRKPVEGYLEKKLRHNYLWEF